MSAPSPTPPYKSVALALIFCLLLGPVGLLYASFWGGIFMIPIGIFLISNKLGFCVILTWIISCIWGVGAAESYNQSIFKKNKYRYE